MSTKRWKRHKILGMHVGIFGVNAAAEPALDKVPANTVASLNTHDTATFMGFGPVPTSKIESSLACSQKRKRNRSINTAQRSEKR